MSEFVPHDAIVLCGGRGTRLRPVVSDRPKPLAWVAGRPFISHVLEPLERFGIRRCVLATGYLGDQFERVFGSRFGKMELDYSPEPEALGTGGAFRLALDRLGGERTVALLNGDSFCECDWHAFTRAHRTAGFPATMAVVPSRAAGRFGGPVCDGAGKVVSFVAASENDVLINAGIYLIEPKIGREISGNRVCSIENDIFPFWAEAGSLQAVSVPGPLLDIGLPESFLAAQRYFRRDSVPKFSRTEELRALNPEAAAMLTPRAATEINRWKLAVGVIARDVRGNILMERRADCGLWGLPGGRMDFGESVEATACREFREETGLEIRVERLVGVYSDPTDRILSYDNGDIVQCVTIVVEASIGGGDLKLSNESQEMAFFSPASIPREVLPQAHDCLIDCLTHTEARVR